MPESLSRADYEFVREILHKRAGHELGEGKEYLVESRLSVLAEARSLGGSVPLLDRLRRFRERSLEDALVEAMMTGETSFYRNPSLFDRLQRFVLPELIRTKTTRRLRIWSAGCSTGQEPYSIAMLIADHLPELLAWDFSIIATDLSESALNIARDGSYNNNELRRGLTQQQIQLHFEPAGLRMRIRPSIRKLVRFERVNLIESLPYHDEFDLVFLRNVLIYFDPEIKPRIFETVRDTMLDDGYLFLGDSETILGVSQAFQFAAGHLDCFRPV